MYWKLNLLLVLIRTHCFFWKKSNNLVLLITLPFYSGIKYLTISISIEFLMRYISMYFLSKFGPYSSKKFRNTDFSSCKNVARTFLEMFYFWLFLLFKFVLEKYVWYTICSSDIGLYNKKKFGWFTSWQYSLTEFDIIAKILASHVILQK